MIDELLKSLGELENVVGIAIGGSRASDSFDLHSDYDVYVYYKDDVDQNQRKVILDHYCEYYELENHYWEKEDNCILKDKTPVDLVYRNFEDFAGIMNRLFSTNEASNGYTTCLWHNLIHSKIIFDPSGMLHDLQHKYDRSYPEELRKNIIQRNLCLLSGYIPSYDDQIKKAVKRNDMVSINHRLTEFLSSYFDLILAVNRKTHPGEKRLISYCLKECQKLPSNFKINLENLFQFMYHDHVQFIQTLDEIVQCVKEFVQKEI